MHNLYPEQWNINETNYRTFKSEEYYSRIWIENAVIEKGIFMWTRIGVTTNLKAPLLYGKSLLDGCSFVETWLSQQERPLCELEGPFAPGLRCLSHSRGLARAARAVLPPSILSCARCVLRGQKPYCSIYCVLDSVLSASQTLLSHFNNKLNE